MLTVAKRYNIINIIVAVRYKYRGDKMRKWLVQIRRDKKFTQEKIANEVHIARAYYSQIENGDRRPSVDVAKKIASYLQFNWTNFYDET